MSKRLKLLNELEEAVKRQDALMAIRSGKAEGIAKRELTEDELAEFDLLEEQIVNLKREIASEEKFEEAAKRNAAQHFMNVSVQENKEEKRIKKEFSLMRALNLASKNRKIDGIEGEVFQIAIDEAREKGQNIEGNFALPSSMVYVPNKRDITAGTAATAGNLVATELGEMVPALSPRLKVVELGATVMENMVGNFDLPVGNAQASASWAGENTTAAETTPSTILKEFRPNRLAAYTDVSRRFMTQVQSRGAELWIRNELSGAIRRAVDLAAINGSGSSNQPTGILNIAGIGDVAGGTNGAVPTFANIVELETQIAIDDADVENMSYLVTPGTRGVLKTTAQTANNAGYIWTADNKLNGYNTAVSTQVPSNLTKGTSSGVCHAIIFGNWADLIIAQWGATDLIVNPYTKGKEALVEIIVNSEWDINVKHAESFAAMKDALLS